MLFQFACAALDADNKQIVYALPSPLASAAAEEEDIKLLNYCCAHNFNDTKIKKPLCTQRAGRGRQRNTRSFFPQKWGKWSEPTRATTTTTTKASESPWQWLPEKFPLNLLTIFASHKLCHAYRETPSHTHTHAQRNTKWFLSKAFFYDFHIIIIEIATHSSTAFHPHTPRANK